LALFTALREIFPSRLFYFRHGLHILLRLLGYGETGIKMEYGMVRKIAQSRDGLHSDRIRYIKRITRIRKRIIYG